MRTFIGTISFSLAVWLNSIELSSQQSLRVLFPDSEGDVLPPIEKLPYTSNENLENIRRIVDGNLTKFDPKSTLIARKNIIVGWKDRDIIRPLSDLAGKTDHVFDTYIKQFVPLDTYNLWKLGIDRRISFVQSSDKAAAAKYRKRLQENIHAKSLIVPQGNHEMRYEIDRESILRTIYEANHEANCKAEQQAKQHAILRTIYGASYEANHLAKQREDRKEILQTIHGANRELDIQETRESNDGRSHREEMKDHNQVYHGGTDHMDYLAHYQVNHQANRHLIHGTSHQAYDTALDRHFGGNRHN